MYDMYSAQGGGFPMYDMYSAQGGGSQCTICTVPKKGVPM